MATAPVAEVPADVEALVARARALGPALAARATETETQRRLPDETAAQLRDAGLLRAFIPKQFGGYDLEIYAVVELARELGRHCGNTAWCTAIFNLHNRIVAFQWLSPVVICVLGLLVLIFWDIVKQERLAS